MFGDIGKLMKLAGQMKRRMPELQEKLANTEFSAEVGDGAVQATVNGKLAIRAIKIAPSLLAGGDVDVGMVEDMIKAAVAAAQEKAAAEAAAAMKELTAGLPMDGLEGLMQ